MPSLDFVYDLVEKFDDENLDYLVLSMREGKTENKVDVFFNINPEAEENSWEEYRQKKHKRRLAADAERKAENETYKMQREVEKIQNKQNQIIKSKVD